MRFLNRLFGKKVLDEPASLSMNNDYRIKYQKLFKDMEKSSIQLKIDKDFQGECTVGRSKIGGNPDLPQNFKWFRYEGEHFSDGSIAERPLSFIAQINCSDACKYDESGLLPTSGMLYFFYDMATNKWGFDPKDKGSAQVFYYAGDIAGLIRTKLPEDLPSEPYNFRIPETPIIFSCAMEIPDFEEFVQLCDDNVEYDSYDEYMDAAIQLGYKTEEDDFDKSKLLGYANLVQDGMLLECECASNGIYCGDRSVVDKYKQYKENGKHWQLLFQLGSFNIGDYELMWGDMGRIFYYVKIDDLKMLNFSDCWLVLQCG